MSRALVVLATIPAILATATAASAQTAIASDERPFRFQFEQSASPRGLAVEGWVYNGLPWRITNVRVHVDSIDANGTLVASASGWVLGDVAAGGRGYLRPCLRASGHVSPERSNIRQGDARSAGAPGALSDTPAEE
jgi:hypothetical protein